MFRFVYFISVVYHVWNLSFIAGSDNTLVLLRPFWLLSDNEWTVYVVLTGFLYHICCHHGLVALYSAYVLLENTVFVHSVWWGEHTPLIDGFGAKHDFRLSVWIRWQESVSAVDRDIGALVQIHLVVKVFNWLSFSPQSRTVIGAKFVHNLRSFRWPFEYAPSRWLLW